MKNIRPLFFVTLVLLLAVSCASSLPENSLGKGEKPLWITQRPSSSVYYVGIGGSSTGNQAEDKEIARSRALTELSSEIFASIESTLDISATDSSETGESYLVRQNIIQRVEQDLESVETVETWFSEQDGYWYYMRLSRAEWEAIQERRARELAQRIEGMFADVFRDTLAELKTIDRAYGEYRNNYTGRKVRMDLFGQQGSTDTLLILRAEELLNGLTIPDPPFPPEMPQMQPVVFAGKIESAGGRNAGAIQLDLLREGDAPLGRIPADPDGSFEWVYRVAETPGEVNYILRMVSPFTHPDLNSQLSYALPRVSRSVLVTPLLVRMELTGPTKDDPGLYERSFNLLDSMTPFTLTTGETDKAVKVEFSYNEAPPNDYGIIISYGRSFVSLVSGEGETVLWQSREEKTGGLTLEQARERVSDILLESMEQDAALKKRLEEITF